MSGFRLSKGVQVAEGRSAPGVPPAAVPCLPWGGVERNFIRRGDYKLLKPVVEND